MKFRYRIWFAAAALASLAVAAYAQSDAFPFGDPKLGHKAYQAKCGACHERNFGGDGSSVFTRPDHRVSSAQSLLAWVERCNARSHAGLGGEEEQSVAAYLNATYYKFK
jgi:mono/diheme cytochrome c family protein